MSGKEKVKPTLGSLNSREGNDKEQLIVATENGFFDAMLTFGWLAQRRGDVLDDDALSVIEVNDALLYWLRETQLTDVLDELPNGIPLKDFLEQILQEEHRAVASIVAGNLVSITEKIESFSYQQVLANPDSHSFIEDEPEGQYTRQRTLRFINSREDASLLKGLLAGVRVVAPGAVRLRSASERDRVDLVSVCQTIRVEDGWRVNGYQGMLQQAWLRVKAVITAGTQAGTVGLMGRNMSHNIGSHALFYLETDEKDDEGKKIFYRYLRERMELLAGFATSMPLSSSTERFSKLVEGFNNNQELLTRIAKSEHVENVKLAFDSKTDCDVALPGGVLSTQALYAILENNIRDSAKHGRTKRSRQEALSLQISLRVPNEEFKDDFIQVVVSDNRRNFQIAQSRLQSSLHKLRIVDEVGRLMPGDWGIKERFISAALLRGLRLEDMEIQRQVGNRQEIKFELGEYAPSGEPRILEITEVDGNLGWVFYLLKPKDVLFIREDCPEDLTIKLTEEFGERINIQPFKWLKDNIASPSKVRHRFVIVYINNENELADLEGLADKLPYRVIVCVPDGLKLSKAADFAGITQEDLDLEKLSLARLYHLWVNYLVDTKNLTTGSRWLRRWRQQNPETPELAFSDQFINLLKLDEETGQFHWQLINEEDFEPTRPVFLFDRHGSCKEEHNGVNWTKDCARFHDQVFHYEPYDQGDATSQITMRATDQINRNRLDRPLDPPELGFSFLEAGLTKILIVDERIDPTSEKQMTYEPYSKVWRCSTKELFKWKGIDLHGEEYADDNIPGPEVLIKWTKQAHKDRKSGYDFLVLHKGIVDKLIKRIKKAEEKSEMDLMKELFAQLRENVRHIIVHSGRMSASELPPGVKFMPLSNVDTWIKNNFPKTKIVEDLCLLRRPRE